MLREAHRLEDITKAVRTKAAMGLHPKRSLTQIQSLPFFLLVCLIVLLEYCEGDGVELMSYALSYEGGNVTS
jgi:hypothetical protein